MKAIVCLTLLCVFAVFEKGDSSFTIDIETVEVENGESKHGVEQLSRINKGNVCFGTPEPQCFTLMMDTGSSDLWISSTRCEGDLCDDVQNKFDRTKSATYTEDVPKQEADLKYGTGKAHIIYGKDTVQIGGISVQNQDLAEATNAHPKIIAAKLDGIMGLAFKALAHNSMTPIFYNMYQQQHALDNSFENVMTFCKPSGHQATGELTFGSRSPESYDAAGLAYVPVKGDKWWRFTLNSLDIARPDGNKEQVCSNCDAVADSGSTLINGPKDQIEKINTLIGATIDSKGQYYMLKSCNTDDLPTIEFNIGGKIFKMPPLSYVYKTKNGDCRTGFVKTRTKQQFWILGGTFLDGLCTIYDMGNEEQGVPPQLGFAEMKVLAPEDDIGLQANR